MSARVVAFPVQRSAAELRAETERQREATFRQMCGAVLSVADELRAWNADVVHSQQWRALHDAANRMAAETSAGFKLRRESDLRDFFAALYDLAEALSYFANELGVLALGRK